MTKKKQFNCYITHETHKAAREKALIEGRSLSSLLEEWMEAWLRKPTEPKVVPQLSLK